VKIDFGKNVESLMTPAENIVVDVFGKADESEYCYSTTIGITKPEEARPFQAKERWIPMLAMEK